MAFPSRIAVDLGGLTMIRRSGNALELQSQIAKRQSTIIAIFGCGQQAALGEIFGGTEVTESS